MMSCEGAIVGADPLTAARVGLATRPTHTLDLGMGFNTFRGDNRTFAVIVLVPAADHELRVLRHEPAWRAACSAITRSTS